MNVFFEWIVTLLNLNAFKSGDFAYDFKSGKFIEAPRKHHDEVFNCNLDMGSVVDFCDFALKITEAPVVRLYWEELTLYVKTGFSHNDLKTAPRSALFTPDLIFSESFSSISRCVEGFLQRRDKQEFISHLLTNSNGAYDRGGAIALSNDLYCGQTSADVSASIVDEISSNEQSDVSIDVEVESSSSVKKSTNRYQDATIKIGLPFPSDMVEYFLKVLKGEVEDKIISHLINTRQISIAHNVCAVEFNAVIRQYNHDNKTKVEWMIPLNVSRKTLKDVVEKCVSSYLASRNISVVRGRFNLVKV
jgi:uncharacterized Fe-S cluster protein YjdI